MLQRSVREATPAEVARIRASSERGRTARRVSPLLTASTFTLLGVLIAALCVSTLRIDRRIAFAVGAVVGGIVGVWLARRDAPEEPDASPVADRTGAPVAVEELRVRASGLVTCGRPDGEDVVHLLQVGPRELLVVHDVIADVGLVEEGAAALARFPSREFVVVREVGSGSVLSVGGVTEPLPRDRVLAPGEIDLHGLWQLDVVRGTLDDLPGAFAAHRRQTRG